jgi:homoserine kinase type II
MAVFTPVSASEASQFLEAYDLGALVSLEGVAEGVENTNFRLETTQRVFALTLFEKRVNPDALPFYLGLMEHLAERGVPAPAPRRNRSGALVGVLNGRAAAIVDWLPGAWLRAPSLVDQGAAGRTLAQLHQASADFPMIRANALGLEGWRNLVERCAWRARGEAGRMLAVLAAEVAWLAARWPEDLATGAIHADFFPDNVLFQSGRVTGVIDYYFACTDTLAYDLAIALGAWGFSAEGAPDEAALEAFTAGYEQLRPLSPAERDALPILCRGAAVRFTLTRLHDRLFHDDSWLVTPKDPTPYFRRLEFYQGQDRGPRAAVS